MTAFQKKIFAVFLALAMMVPSTSFVYAEDTATMCQNHQQHDETCGYVAPSEGSPCTFVHEHDESCGYAEPSEGSPCTFVHEHDESCGYAAPSEGSPCTFVHEHDESCGYDETTGEGCTFVHEHNESCGYAAPSEGSPCTFVHEHDETCGYVAPSEGSPCTFVHEHDEYCGYAEPREGSPCTHTCDLCNPMAAVENTEPEEDTNLSQVTTNTLLTPTPSTRSSYTSEDFSGKYTITDSSGQIVTSLNTTDLYTVTITGVPDGYAFKNEETGEEFVSFGISNTEATDADSLQNTWNYIDSPEKQADGKWVLENFRLNNNMTGKGRFMTWFDGANVLGYSAVYEITASEVSSDVEITNICYERPSGGSFYSFALYSEAFGLLEDKSTGTDYETYIRIYTANNETGSPCNVTDLFKLEKTTFYAEDARGEKHALEHNAVLMGEGIQESYIDIKLSPLYIGNDKGITFSMPTDWTNPDRDKLIISKAEVYVNGTLSRRVTMSDGRPGEEPSSRIFSLGMSMSGTSPAYTLNGRFEKDVVVSLDVLYPNGIGATIYNGTAEIEISSDTPFQLNGAGTAETSHTVKIPITGGSGSFRVISATTDDGDLFLSDGTEFNVKATLVQKADEQYGTTVQTDSFKLSEENNYRKYTGTLDAKEKEGVAINLTIGDDVTSAVTDTDGKFTFFAESGLKEVDVIRVVLQGETGFYLYNHPVTGNSLTITLETLKIPVDFTWITHNENNGEIVSQAFTEEEYHNIKFYVNQNSRAISWEISEDSGQYYLVLKNLLEIQDEDYFSISYKISNYTQLYAYPRGSEIEGFTLEKEFPKAGSITVEFAAGINENDYAVGIYTEKDGYYTRKISGKIYNPSNEESYDTYRVVFSTYLPDYILYEEDFELGVATNSLYYEDVTGGLGIDKTVTLKKELSKSDYYDVRFSSQKMNYRDTDNVTKSYFSMNLTDYSANLFGKVLRFDIPDGLEFIPDENGEITLEFSNKTRTKVKITETEEGYYISEPLPEAENAQSRQYTICVTITLRQFTSESGTVTASVQNLGGSGYIVLGNVHIEGRSDVSVSASPLVYQDGILEYSLNCDYTGGILNGEVIEISEKYNKFEPFSIQWESYGTSYPLHEVDRFENVYTGPSMTLKENLKWTNGEPQNGEQLILCTKIQGYNDAPVVAGTTTYTDQSKPSVDFVEYLLCREYPKYSDDYEEYYIIHPDQIDNKTITYNNTFKKAVYEAKINKDKLPEGKELYTMAVVMHQLYGQGDISFFLEPTEEDDSIWTRTNEFYQLPYISRYSLAYSFRPKVELPEETDKTIDFDYEEYQADLEKLSDKFGQSVTSLEQQSGNNANGYDYSGFETTVNIGEIGETEVTMYSSSVGFKGSPEEFYSKGNVYSGKATMADDEVVDVVSKVQLFRCDDPDDPSDMIELTAFDEESIRKFYQEGIQPETLFVQYVTSSVIKDGKYYDFDTYCNEASGQGDSGRSVFMASTRNGASNGKFLGQGGGVKPKSDTSSDLQDFGSQTAITFTSDAVQGAVETGRFVDRFSTGAGLVSGALSGIGHSMEFGPVINDIENCIARARNVRDRYGEYLTEAEIQTLNQNISNMEYYLGVTKAGFAGAIGTDVAGVGIGLGAAALAPATGGGSVAAGFALNGNVTLGAFASEQIMKKNYNNVMELDASTFKILKDVTARRREAIPSVDNSSLYTSGVAVDMTDGYTYNSGNSSKAVLDGGIGHGGGGGIYGGGTIDQNQLVWIKYDPQGTVYDQDGNPVEDATMTVYFSKNADGSGAVAWVNEGEPNDAGDAAYAEIERPWMWGEPGVQQTNAVGFYAWDVPDGYYYQVVAEKDGYTTAKSDWLRVIPPRFGVDLVMTNLNAGGDDDDDENNNTGTGGGGGFGGGSSSVSYGISVSDDIANGKLTVSDKQAKKGDTVTITTAPDDGYALDTVTVKDEKGKEIKLTDLGNGKFSFTMPDSKITIDAQFVEKTDEIPVVVNPFADVKESDWFYNDVMYVYSKGIMSGTGEKTFEPNTTTNRAMFVAVAWRLEHMPAPENEASFTDVEKGTWYTDAVAWAYENGVASGFGDGTFGPNESITREQLAVFLYKYAQYKGYDLTITGNIDSFSDKDSVSSWAKNAVTWAVQNKIIAGKDGNKLDSKGFATRAEFAAIIHRFIEKMG